MNKAKPIELVKKKISSRPYSILNPICRGIVGYISYLAACSGHTVYSEYILYEPIMRIAQSKSFKVQCEYPLPKPKNDNKENNSKRGDNKRIDFYLSKKDEEKNENIGLGIEVKWIDKKLKPKNLKNDIEKLKSFSEQKHAHGYLVLFGLDKHFEENKLKEISKLSKSSGKKINFDGKTNYAACWFKIC